MSETQNQRTERAPGVPIVFAGITLNPAEITATVAAAIRPPVKRGDLDHFGCGTVVALIDGELSENFAIPLQEIYRALDRGVKISGAASVGALRAYEARTGGMIGIGWVYDAYCTGRITGTDEIAVLYDPISYGSLTIPLVNIHFCLDYLRRGHTVTAGEVAHAMGLLKVLKLEERDSRTILLRLSAVLGRSRAKELLRRATLAEAGIKRTDACDLLRSLAPVQARSNSNT